MKPIYFLALLNIFCLLSFNSKAAGYWIEIAGSGKLNEPVRVQVCYGNIDDYGIRHRDTSAELSLTGDFRMSAIDESGQITDISISQKTNCWEGGFIPTHQGTYRIIGVNDTHPVIDRSKTGGKNVRPIDYLCSAYTVGSLNNSITEPIQFLDILTTYKDKTVVTKAFKNKIAAKTGTKLRVFNPENWEKELTVDAQGEAFFAPTMKGLYIIREDWVDPTPGNYKGVLYTATRYRCNYCLLIQ